MPKIYKITKYILNLVFITLLISCGGDRDSQTREIIFPDHLPKVNPNLSQENQAGIWMVYRKITNNSTVTHLNGKTEVIERNIISNELTTISDEPGIYRIGDCTFSNFSPPPSLTSFDANNNGYTKLSRINENDEFGSSGHLEVTYLSSQDNIWQRLE